MVRTYNILAIENEEEILHYKFLDSQELLMLIFSYLKHYHLRTVNTNFY
jgi:hypothetical protein